MIILRLVLLAVFVLAIFLMVKNRRAVPEGQVVTDPLTEQQKVYIWIFSFLNPIFAGAIFYYGWKKKLPTKAKQANQISLWAFFITILISLAFFVLVGFDEERIEGEIPSANQTILVKSDEFFKGFEGKTYVQAISYCESFDSTNKDNCFLYLSIKASMAEGDKTNIVKAICPQLSEGKRVTCYAVFEKCDLIENEVTKTICKSEVEKKNEFIKVNTSSPN